MINVKNIVLGIGIFIVFMLMLGYGIEAFYPSPKYEDFCSGAEFRGPYQVKADFNSESCDFSKALQEQQDECYVEGGQPIFDYDDNGCSVAIKECNMCNKMYNEAQKDYSKVLFIISLIAGIVVLFVGYGLLSTEPVGSALMASGVGAIFYGSIRNWQNLSDIWRFSLLLIALVLLVWIALRLNSRRENGWKFWKK
jgi:hypothetical protein